jgi:hypothetical protein
MNTDNPENIVPLFPQTAAQHNAPLIGAVELPLTADGIRSKLVENFQQFRPALEAYHDYAQRASALAVEYHAARFKEACPQVAVEELSLILTLDCRETPTSLDNKLAQISNVNIKRIIFDRAHSAYHLFV